MSEPVIPDAQALQAKLNRGFHRLVGAVVLLDILKFAILGVLLVIVLGVVSQLKSFTDPSSCVVIFGRYSNAVNRWDLKRNNARVHEQADPPRPVTVRTVPTDEHEVYAPELLRGGRCAHTYRRLEVLLPR